MSCILFDFYIKPQQRAVSVRDDTVVSYSISTSNHNYWRTLAFSVYVVSYSISTSNHNAEASHALIVAVVSYSISTSNHNVLPLLKVLSVLYLIRFLHQTTTLQSIDRRSTSCILFDFYIKPQLLFVKLEELLSCILFDFYIKPQHKVEREHKSVRCILFDFYIKPQRRMY